MEGKTILLTATYLVGIGELILAVFFWATHSKSEIRKVMALLALSTGLWVITSGLTAYRSSDGFIAFTNGMVFLSGALLINLLLQLTLIFPFPIIRFDRLHRILLYIPVLIFGLIAFFTNGLQLGSTGSARNAGQVIPGPVYWVYNVYVLLLYVTIVLLLVWRSRRLDGYHRYINNSLLLGVTIGGIPAVFVDLVVPLFFPSLLEINYLYGVIFTGVWLGTTTFIITRK